MNFSIVLIETLGQITSDAFEAMSRVNLLKWKEDIHRVFFLTGKLLINHVGNTS